MIETAVIVPMTAEMVRAAAAVHLSALADSRSALMGERYVRSFVDWFRQPEHGGIALAAIDNRSDVVGYAIGAPLGYPQAQSRDLFWTSAVATLTRPWLIFKPQFRSGIVDRVRLVLTAAIPARTDLALPPPTMSLAAMAVVRAFRRKKLGLRLLEDFVKRSAEMGMRSLRLSTRSDNVAARRFYEDSGWRLLADSGELVYYSRTL